MFYKDDRLALFIDGSNLYAAAKALGFDIDYKLLRQEFMRRGKLLRAFYYTALLENDEYSPIRPLVDWLHYNGFTMVTKPAKEYTDSQGRRKVKGNMDIELTVDAMELAPRVDHIVLFSGDGDFRPLVESLQRQGVRVSVVSTIRSQPPMIADELRRQADNFIELDELRDVIGRPPREPRPIVEPGRYVGRSEVTERAARAALFVCGLTCARDGRQGWTGGRSFDLPSCAPTAAEARMTKPPLTLYLAAPRGFCAGVDRAIKIVEMALEKWGAPVYVRHEIVHNKFVVDGLRAEGAVFVEELDEVPVRPPGDLLGPRRAEVGPRRSRAARDDLCRCHLPAGQQGPHRGRAAPRGGLADGDDRPSRPPRDDRHDGPAAPRRGAAGRNRRQTWPTLSVRDPERLAFITQTTLSVDDTAEIVAALQARFPGNRRAAQGRHLLRHDQPAGGRQGRSPPRSTRCW